MSFWDERFAEPDLAYGAEPNDFVRAMAEKIPEGPVLCLAEGQGRNAVWLAMQGHEVTAVDGSAVGMARARALAADRGVSLRTEVADLAAWDGPEGTFAGIILIFAHFPPALRERVHRSVLRWLKPGGVVILEAYRPEQIHHATGGPQDPAMLPTVAILRNDFAGLGFEWLEEVDREVHEGAYHNGPSAVVQCVARRPLA